MDNGVCGFYAVTNRRIPVRTFVKMTKRFETEAKAKHHFNVFRNEKESAESNSDFPVPKRQCFRFGPYVKIRRGNARLVYLYKKCTVAGQEVLVLVFLRDFQRGDHDYDRFKSKMTSEGERNSILSLQDVDWDAICAEIASELDALPPPILPELSQAELEFIQPGAGVTHDILKGSIYEGEDWVNAVVSTGFNDFSYIHDEILSHMTSEHTVPMVYNESYGRQGRHLVFACCEHPKGGEAWFLLGVGMPDELRRILSRLHDMGETPKFKDLLALCGRGRAYPASMMVEAEDMWREDIEKDREGCYILSDEEYEILKTGVQFPLFLTGRAGCGKSTMLQYIFADYALRYARTRDGNLCPPLYLSYTKELVDNAASLTEKLLTKNNIYLKKLDEAGLTFERDVKPRMPGMLYVFQDLLKECIADHEFNEGDEEDQETVADAGGEGLDGGAGSCEDASLAPGAVEGLGSPENDKKADAMGGEPEMAAVTVDGAGDGEPDAPAEVISGDATEAVADVREQATTLAEKAEGQIKEFTSDETETSLDADTADAGALSDVNDAVVDAITGHLSPEASTTAVPRKSILETRFADKNYISFSRFRLEWEKRFKNERGAREAYGPDISWHVIRTYIKGWDCEKLCDPAEYHQLGQNSRDDVSEDVFAKIYQRVWKGFYEGFLRDNGCWDDQDLVRYCLKNENGESCADARFSAIICDEAQDFTRIEMEFILRLSTFSHRQIHNRAQFFQLPFIFAGDEFQTINPTGFSWKSLRSNFCQSLAARVKFAQGSPEPKQLKNNYRSEPPIVRLGNRLQLIRLVRCGLTDAGVGPQKPYYESANHTPVCWLPPKERGIWKAFEGKNAALIVNAEDGQDVREYLKNSAIKEMFKYTEEGYPVGWSIYNPMQAKGLEYPLVALYGFDHMRGMDVNSLEAWLSNPGPLPDGEGYALELKYFFSKVYVAATRAKRKLFIMTDCKEENAFWRLLCCDGQDAERARRIEEMLLNKLPKNAGWETSSLGWLEPGDEESIRQETAVPAQDRADALAKNGESRGDPTLLEQAADAYVQAGQGDQATLCRAKAATLRGEYSRAGDHYSEIADNEKAVDAYWLDYSWNGNEVSLNKLREFKTSARLEVALARDTISGLTLGNMASLCDRLKRHFLEEPGCATRYADGWKRLIKAMLGQVKGVSQNQQGLVGEFLENVQPILLALPGLDIADRLGRLAFEAGLYAEAVAQWDTLPKKPKGYNHAKAEVTPFPEALKYLEHSDDPGWQRRACELWDADRLHGGPHELSGDQCICMVKALLGQNRISDAEELLPKALSSVLDLATGERFLQEARKKGCHIQADCVKSLFKLRFASVDGWNDDGKRFSSAKLNDLYRVLRKIKEISRSKYVQEFSRLEKAKDIMAKIQNEWQEYQRNTWNIFLLVEWGRMLERMEHRDLASMSFYAWALDRREDVVNSKILEEHMSVRWVASALRYFEHKPTKSLTDLGDINRRKEDERKIQKIQSMYPNGNYKEERPRFSHWLWAFEEVLKASRESGERKPKGGAIPKGPDPLVNAIRAARAPIGNIAAQLNNLDSMNVFPNGSVSAEALAGEMVAGGRNPKGRSLTGDPVVAMEMREDNVRGSDVRPKNSGVTEGGAAGMALQEDISKAKTLTEMPAEPVMETVPNVVEKGGGESPGCVDANLSGPMKKVDYKLKGYVVTFDPRHGFVRIEDSIGLIKFKRNGDVEEEGICREEKRLEDENGKILPFEVEVRDGVVRLSDAEAGGLMTMEFKLKG